MTPRPPQPADRESTLVSVGPHPVATPPPDREATLVSADGPADSPARETTLATLAPAAGPPPEMTFANLGEVGSPDTIVPPRLDADTSVKAPLLGASAPSLPAGVPAAVGRYQVLGKVGAGGMGVVCRAFEPGLARDVAVKLLLPHCRHDPATARRFHAEARVTGQLQHPGIPPVFEVGDLPDASPFLAMKLIQGRDLATILKGEETENGRLTPAAVARMLPVFEKICQAVGYAHSRGIVHRDLKPANVMVGAFGEVQVMDWGLAKDVRAGGTGAETADDRTHAEVPSVRTSDPHAPRTTEATVAGSVLGTPAYMAPEQARGHVADLDARADVFALGGILSAILTGSPPFTGGEAWATVALAATGDVSAAFARLDATGADPDLVALCKRCLAPDRADRPADGGAVAALVADLRAEAAERAHRAELQRAADAARAAADRKRRQAQFYLAASGLALVGLGGFVAWWQTAVTAQHDRERFDLEQKESAARVAKADADKAAADARAANLKLEKEAADKAQHEREDRARRLERVTLGVQRLIGEAASLRDRALWADAEQALASADRMLDPGAERSVAGWPRRDELADDVKAARRDLAFVRRLDRVRLSKWLFLAARDNVPQTIADYRAAFAENGFDVPGGDAADLVDRVRASAVRGHLVAALDDWAYRAGPEVRTRLTEITAGATGQGWRRALAAASADSDPKKLEAEYARAPLDQMSAAMFFAVGREALRRGQDRFGVRVIEDGLRRHPNDLWLLYFRSIAGRGDQTERKVAASWTALAIRPDVGAVHFNLGNALMDRRDLDGAMKAYEQAIILDPSLARARSSLALAMMHKENSADLFDEAIRHLERAVADDPADGWIRFHLGIALARHGKKPEAMAAYRDAIARDPLLVGPRYELGALSWEAGDVGEAVVQFREVVFLDPENAEATYRLGLALTLWNADPAEAADTFRRAVRLNPTDVRPRMELGVLLYDAGDKPGAEMEVRGAVRVAPTDPRPHELLAGVLSGRGGRDRVQEAKEERAEAARLRATAPKAVAPKPPAPAPAVD